MKLIAILFALLLIPFSTSALAQQSCVWLTSNNLVSQINVRSSKSDTSAILRTIPRGKSECALRLEGDWYVMQNGGFVFRTVAVIVTVTSTPTLSVSSTPTRTPTATGPPITPTRFVTNTPIPPAVRTETAKQFSLKVCFFEKGDDGGVCHLFPYDTQVIVEVVQNNP